MSSVQRLPHRCNDSRGMSAFLLVFLSISRDSRLVIERRIFHGFDVVDSLSLICNGKKRFKQNQSYLYRYIYISFGNNACCAVPRTAVSTSRA